ncbi:hypothetical protein GAYE_HTGSCF31FUTG100G0362 [Galdieria yellowstonensis]|uniref:DNA primase n=1 Tax=Galdieria yellowstonensis TaxID=3028027 RepID=A0AAV9I371_9RHOD|nr:hypothetical protein GAYE_HTGSCF31FUTG100G0362 [Galdieria yellowstonensis]
MQFRREYCDESKPILQVKGPDGFMFCNVESLKYVPDLVEDNKSFAIFEIIKPNSDCKLFFDIDKVQSQDEFEVILATILSAFNLERQRAYIWKCERPSKPLSFHVIFEDTRIEDFPIPRQSWVKTTFQVCGIAADPCVYSKYRAFRVPFSVKGSNDPYPFLPYGREMDKDDAYYSLVQSEKRGVFPLKSIRIGTRPLEAHLKKIDLTKGYIIQVEKNSGERKYVSFPDKASLLEFWEKRDRNDSYHEVIIRFPVLYLDLDHKTEKEAKEIVFMVRVLLQVPDNCREVWYHCQSSGGYHILFPEVRLADYPIYASNNVLKDRVDLDVKVYETNSSLRMPFSGPKYYTTDNEELILLTDLSGSTCDVYMRKKMIQERTISGPVKDITDAELRQAVKDKFNIEVDIGSRNGRFVNLLVSSSYMCPFKIVHDRENPFLIVTEKGVYFKCRRCGKKELLA